MKVICIDDSTQQRTDAPHVKKGIVYTVVDSYERKDAVHTPGFINPSGLYYVLEGMPENFGYHSSIFAPIREVRDHKSIAVPEELLVIKEGDILEPSKILI